MGTVPAVPTGLNDASKFQLRDSDWLKEADIDVVEDGIYSIHTATNQVIERFTHWRCSS